MTAVEIFEKVIHQIKEDIELNKQLSQAFFYMKYDKYKDIHESLFIQGNCIYLILMNYCIYKYDELPKETSVGDESVIPGCWYSRKSSEMSQGVKKTALSNFMNIYLSKIKESITIYKEAYDNLLSIGDIYSACKIYDIIEEMENNLHSYEVHYAQCKAVDFDPLWVLSQQEKV